MTTTANDHRSHEDIVLEILGRYSVHDLIEQTDADLDNADVLFYKSKLPINVTDQGAEGLVRWWIVSSGDKTYHVRRFKNFAWCSCKDFFFRKKACKHVAVTAGVYCERCRVLSAKVGKLCYDCNQIVNRFLRPAAVKVASVSRSFEGKI